jgi:2-polyprenyl-3-methyl-5-hydroxy-6-metoxy-1,4-benzoquinol methylase
MGEAGSSTMRSHKGAAEEEMPRPARPVRVEPLPIEPQITELTEQARLPRAVAVVSAASEAATATADERERYWSAYYRKLVDAPDWLDYSNERVQSQTFSLALEAAGPLVGRRCLDLGCGWGRFTVGLHALGADVTGIDLVSAFIERNRTLHRDIRWHSGSLPDAAFEKALGTFDAVFAVEVLQLMPFRQTVASMWRLLRPGGRIVASVPNRLCAIVASVVERFEGRYDPPSADDVRATLADLPDLETWAYRGLHFREDQRLFPYSTSTWTQDTTWAIEPNRLVFVAQKKI